MISIGDLCTISMFSESSEYIRVGEGGGKISCLYWISS